MSSLPNLGQSWEASAKKLDARCSGTPSPSKGRMVCNSVDNGNPAWPNLYYITIIPTRLVDKVQQEFFHQQSCQENLSVQ